jgi:putative membrane protein
MDWKQEGADPDYRFSLANERTCLAWIRTALAILAGGVVLHQLYEHSLPRWLSASVGLSVSAISCALAVGAYRQWRAYEIAMRHARPLPRSRLLPLLATIVVISGLLAAALVLMKR